MSFLDALKSVLEPHAAEIEDALGAAAAAAVPEAAPLIAGAEKLTPEIMTTVQALVNVIGAELDKHKAAASPSAPSAPEAQTATGEQDTTPGSNASDSATAAPESAAGFSPNAAG